MPDHAGTPGGCVPARDPGGHNPVGPSRDSGVGSTGLGGTNHGTAGTQGANFPNHPVRGGESPVPFINRR